MITSQQEVGTFLGGTQQTANTLVHSTIQVMCCGSIVNKEHQRLRHSGSGGGLHLFPAGDAAGGTVICKGTGWEVMVT